MEHGPRPQHIILLFALPQHRQVVDDLRIYPAGSDKRAGQALLFLIIKAAHDR